MGSEYFYLIYGILIGWATKVPFLIKWYKELRSTNDYIKAERFKRLYKTYYKFYPPKP